MILLFMKMNVLPEKHKEMTQTLLSMIEPTEREKGCLSYDVFCDIEDKNLLSLMEVWKNREYLDRHLKTKSFGVLLGTKSLLSEPMKIQIHTVSRSEEMAAVSAANNKKM
jgi:quinol monooxygenase YgiN